VGLRDRVRIGCAGKVITAFDIVRMLALGADWCNSARGFMMAVGCIQAQTCHTGHCPTGVTTQDALRQRALVPTDKAPRVAHFHKNTLHALQELLQAAGLKQTDDVEAHHIVRRIDDAQVRLLSTLIPLVPEDAILDDLDKLPTVYRLFWPMASAQSFQLAHAEPTTT
jgi:glutamate synthase domain-containing protein 2